MADDLSARLAALFFSGSLHLAAGYLLFAALDDGAPARGLTRGDSGLVMIVELLPLDRSGGAGVAERALKEADESTSPSREPPVSPEEDLSVQHELRAAGPASREAAPAAESIAVARQTSELPNAEVLSYRRRLEDHLARFRTYPVAARDAGHEGIVTIHFEMTAEGTVLDAWIETSSGYALIDREALDAVQRAQPLPPFPNGWPSRLDVSLPVTFKLG